MKPCNDCPFVKKNPLNGSPDWLKDVIRRHKENEFFNHTCHKTDPKADGYKKAKKVRACHGHLGMQLNSLCKTPGAHGLWKSIHDMVDAYLKHWLGELEFRKLKRENYEKLRR